MRSWTGRLGTGNERTPACKHGGDGSAGSDGTTTSALEAPNAKVKLGENADSRLQEQGNHCRRWRELGAAAASAATVLRAAAWWAPRAAQSGDRVGFWWQCSPWKACAAVVSMQFVHPCVCICYALPDWLWTTSLAIDGT